MSEKHWFIYVVTSLGVGLVIDGDEFIHHEVFNNDLWLDDIAGEIYDTKAPGVYKWEGVIIPACGDDGFPEPEYIGESVLLYKWEQRNDND